MGIDMGMERMAGLVLSVFLSCSLEAWDCGRSLESVSFFLLTCIARHHINSLGAA